MPSISIIKEQEFPLLHRKNIMLNIEFPKKPTPSEKDIKKEAASFLKTEENRVAIKNINQQFGSNNAVVTVYLYKDEKSLKAIEEIKKKKKKAEQQNVQEAQAKK